MRKVTSVAAAVVAVPMLVAGTPSSAQAHDHDHHHSYPASKGWIKVNDTATYKDVCSKPITIHTRGHERVLTLEHHHATPVTDPNWTPKAGDAFLNQSPDETIYVYRTGHKAHGVFRHIGGEFYNKVTQDGQDLKVVGVGDNLLYGPGVNGLLWVNGVQKFKATDFLSDAATITHLRVHGTTDELCGDLGLTPGNPA